MNRIRVVIADDERLARQRVRTLLAGDEDIEVVAECADGTETVEAVQEHQPDLLFLDVQMPRLDGFGALEVLGADAVPVVIFTTAHDEHALRAFEVHALDYLLKPFKEARFREALTRARERLRTLPERGAVGLEAGTAHAKPSADDGLSALLAQLRSAQSGGPRIAVKEAERIFFLRADQVDHVESAGNYVVVHAGQERHVVRETLTSMERRLIEVGFMRISRSVLVNLHRIRELQPMGASEYCVILRSGARLSMTCSLRDLQQRMAAL